ncbi:MAG TPA: response regulator [Candidatus Polarisedimenticolaceae bacterium]|nr:response regulator [Candidatus Polarisedimenticolaceae bacterium]
MSCNLLLVEDNPLSRRNLAIFLQQAEFTVHQTDNGEAALELISRVNFDVVISDFRLPGKVNGLDVLKYQSCRGSGKRLILITAFGSEQAQAEAASVGALYFEKPISLRDLLDTIHITH